MTAIAMHTDLPLASTPMTMAAASPVDRQAVRMRRFLLAATVYAVSAPLLFFAHAIGLIALFPTLVAAAAMLMVNAVLYVVFRTGFNLRFSDPSLTWHQTAAASAVLLYVVYSFDHDRNLALFMCLVVFLFGAFRFNVREFVFVTLQFLAGYALVINLLMHFRPQTVDVYLEWFQWAALA